MSDPNRVANQICDLIASTDYIGIEGIGFWIATRIVNGVDEEPMLTLIDSINRNLIEEKQRLARQNTMVFRNTTE